jgi:hypothetical protein
MERESLDGLKAAFEEWRSAKRYRQEPIPATLLERARQAARHHGPAAVARLTGVDRGRLKSGGTGRRARRSVSTNAPTFSRLELAAPAAAARPFAELEMVTGLKVRLFTQSNEVFELLSSVIHSGGAQ